MKRVPILKMLLLLALLAVCAAPCARADETLSLDGETIRSICWQGDTLYLLTENLYRWRPGDAAPQPIWQAKGIDTLRYWNTPPEDGEQRALWRQAIAYLFPGPDAPLALHPYSGEIFRVDDSGLTPIAVIPEEARTYEEDGEALPRGVLDAAGKDGVIWLLLDTDDWNDWSRRTILRFDTADSRVQTFDATNVHGIAAAENGQLLLTMNSEGKTSYQLVDGSTGEFAGRYAASSDSGAVWCGGSVLEYHGGELLLRDGTGASSVKGYAPAGNHLFGELACSEGGLCAVSVNGRAFIRDLNHPAEQTVLTIAGYLNPFTVLGFSLDNPDIAVVALDESTQQAALTGRADLYVVDAPGLYGALARRRGLAPIASEELTRQAASFYEGIRTAIMPEGTLLAWPINMEPETWAFNETLWERFDLGDAPTSYPALMEALERWQENDAEENPDYMLAELPGTLARCLKLVMREYILQCGDAYPDFTGDDFRQAVLSLMAHEAAIEQNAESYGMPLIISYSVGFGLQSLDGTMTRMMLKPAIIPGGGQKMAARLELLAISANSRHQEAAGRFILWCAEHMESELRYMLDPTLNTPLRRDDYETRLADLNDQKAAIEASLAEAEDESFRDQLERLEQRIARWESEDGWLISEASIANYRDVATHLVVPYNSPLLASEGGMASLDERIEQACGKGLTEASLDVLLRELNSVARMVMQENQ